MMKAKPSPRSCLNCGCHHPKYVGFLLRGIFGQRNCVPPFSISSVSQNDGPGDDDVNESVRCWNKPQYEGRKLWFCIDCAIKESSLSGKNDIVLGFLTRRQSDDYTKHAKLMMQLQRDGYIVLNKCQVQDTWALASYACFGGDFLKKCFELQTPTVGNLKDNEGGLRRGAFWGGASGQDLFTNAIREMIPECMRYKLPKDLIGDEIIHADVHYGKLARMNYLNNLRGEGKKYEHALATLKNEKCTIQFVNLACLWRGEGITHFQRAHADSGPGHYHMVIPHSNNYKIVMYPGTHLHVERDSPIGICSVTAREAKRLELNVGDILVFCSNLVHHGSISSTQQIPPLFPMETIDIQWFPKSKSDVIISDISIHADLENRLFRKSISSDFSAEAIEFIPVRVEEILCVARAGKILRTENPNYVRVQQQNEERKKAQTMLLENIRCGKEKIPSSEIFHFFDEAHGELSRYKKICTTSSDDSTDRKTRPKKPRID
jgi:hypothetical protein